MFVKFYVLELFCCGNKFFVCFHFFKGLWDKLKKKKGEGGKEEGEKERVREEN